MQQQLSHLHVLHPRLPDGWKPILHQQFQNVPGVPLVGPLLARSRSMNRAGVPQQKLMTQLIHQPLKPAKVPRCLHADTHIPSRQRTVKLLRLPGVAQTALAILPRFLHYVRNLLKTGMKITSYNHHARLLSSRASGRLAATSLLRSREPTLSCNQFQQLTANIRTCGCAVATDDWIAYSPSFSSLARNIALLEPRWQPFCVDNTHTLVYSMPLVTKPMKNATPRDLFPGALEMMILESLRRQPAHGYALVQHIQQRSNNLLQVV